MLVALLVCSLIALGLTQELGSPEVISADVTPLQIQAVEHDGANGLAIACNALSSTAIHNVFYGYNEDSLKKCSDVTIDGNTLNCNDLVLATGNQVLIVERLDASGEVEARHRFQWHYKAPVVQSLTGGADGEPLVVGGQWFGPVDSAAEPVGPAGARLVEVFVGPFAAHTATKPCTVTSGETIVCPGGMPLGFGTGLSVRVCVDGVCGTSERPLHDFPQPVVTSMRTIDGRMHMFGSGFGPLSEVDGEPLSIEIGGEECLNPQIVVPGREIACDAIEHVENKSIVLQRRDVRVTLVKRDTPATITEFFPLVGGTDGKYKLFIKGTDFGTKGSPVDVFVGGRNAIGCVVTDELGKAIECTHNAQGVGANLAVRVGADGVEPADIKFSYLAPTVSSASRPETRGGKFFVFGTNFGPSFAATKVYLFDGEDRTECVVEKKSHTKIQCDAPHGTGEGHNIQVEVGEQISAPNHAFGYKRPDIHATTRPHWAGGHMYIRGHNFGRESHKISVYIDDKEECKYVKLTKSHEEIRCRAPPGAVDGTLHTVKVRVDSQSSSKDGHGFHHMQYGNHPPVFDGVSDHYVAVACDPLAIKLHAHDPDHDEFYFRGRGLPEGATWKNGFDYMQVEYSVPHGLLSYPHTEMDMTIEVGVTDGPGHSSALLHVTARACPATQDTCKDLSCVPRSEMCPRCPTSDLVRCGSGKPVLDTVSGECHPLSAIDEMQVACDPIADAGFTVDVSKHTVVPLFNAQHQQAGLIDVHPNAVHPDGPQPCGESLTCIDVSTCDHRALAAARKGQLRSHAVHVNSPSMLHKGVYLGLPTFDAGIGPVAADGYGHCLGMYNHDTMRWECTDEHLTLRSNMLAGAVHGAGCYAIMLDNCPDHANANQLDRDNNGEGDLCQGGATLCEDCHSWDELNVKYLKKGQPADGERVKDDCAENQSPVVITTDDGDRYFADEL